MGEVRKKRKEKQEAQDNPEGFVCGNCGTFNEFDEENPLVCENCGYGATNDGD